MSEGLRSKIAEIDKRLLELAAERMRIAQQIGKQKRSEGVGVVSPEVEAAVVSRAEALSGSLGLDLPFAHRLIALLIEEAVRIQDPSELRNSQQSFSFFAKAVAEKEKTAKVVRLDRDEDDLVLPKAATWALMANSRKNSLGHPSRVRETFRKMVCDRLNERHGIDLDAEQILITPGGRLAAFMAILALVSQGERAVIPSPAPPLYGNTIRLVGGREYPLHTSLECKWDMDMAKLGQFLHLRPELMVLGLPNNPTGKVYSDSALRETVSMAEEAGTCVLADETYAQEFPATLLRVAESNFVCLNSMSNVLGMDGSGMGYIVSDEDTIVKIADVMQLSDIVPTFPPEAVLEALTESDVCREHEKEMKRRMASATEALDRLPVRYYRPDEGMFLFPKVELEGFDSEVFTRRLLEEEHVMVTPGEVFGDYPKHFRVSLGTGWEDVNKGMAGIRRMLEKWERE